MPSSPNYKRNYREEYDNYHGKPKQRKNRSKRVVARRAAEKDGRVTKGDGKDLDHKKPLSKGGSNGKANTRVTSKTANRSYKRTSTGAIASKKKAKKKG